jgi:hypothetical protein
LFLLIVSCSAPQQRGADAARHRSSDSELAMVLDAPAPCVAPGPETCFNALDDNCNGLVDEGCGLPSGLVTFSVAWEDRTADVDLLVTDPNDELAEVGRVTQSGLTKDADCPGRQAALCSTNLETVYLADRTPTSGQYEVSVRLERLGNDAPPLRVNLGVRVGGLTTSRVLALRYPEDERRYTFELLWPTSSAESPNR